MSITVGSSTITVNSGAIMADPPGTTPLFFARAWVNFNGTGTPAIRASGNVDGITDNNTGNYHINFNTAMTDANFAGSFCGNGLAQIPVFYLTATGSLQVLYYDTGGTPVDNTVCVATIFR